VLTRLGGGGGSAAAAAAGEGAGATDAIWKGSRGGAGDAEDGQRGRDVEGHQDADSKVLPMGRPSVCIAPALHHRLSCMSGFLFGPHAAAGCHPPAGVSLGPCATRAAALTLHVLPRPALLQQMPAAAPSPRGRFPCGKAAGRCCACAAGARVPAAGTCSEALPALCCRWWPGAAAGRRRCWARAGPPSAPLAASPSRAGSWAGCTGTRRRCGQQAARSQRWAAAASLPCALRLIAALLCARVRACVRAWV
jgi:hypothetical protein